MREIKFRAWNSNQNKMLSHEQMQRSNVFALQEGLKPDEFIVLPVLDYWHLMQYTGRKDKYSTEVFDGDILSINYGIPPTTSNIEVYFYDGCWMTKSTNSILECPLFDLPADSLTVIGNIYQNGDLLNDGN